MADVNVVEVTPTETLIIQDAGNNGLIVEEFQVDDDYVQPDLVQVGPQGGQGPAGIQGPPGVRGFYVQATAPIDTPPTYGWMQTGLPPNGTGMTLWIEDGT